MTNVLFTYHWFNIPGLPSKEESLSNESITETRQLIQGNNPTIIHLGNGPMELFEHLIHSDEEIEIINHQGLDIFLYEPLNTYINGQAFNYDYYSEFKFEEDPQNIRSSELDSISLYVSKNRLRNVTIHTCDYQAEKFFPFYDMRIITDDLFLKDIMSKPFTIQHEIKNFNKKFICTNWRYTKHRHIIAAFISKMDAHLSWYFYCPYKLLEENLYFDLRSWKSQFPEIYEQIVRGCEYLNENSPISLDIDGFISSVVLNSYQCHFPVKKDDFVPDPFSITKDENSLLKFYNDSFCEIINETRFAQHTGNFSEKLYKSVRLKIPFILVAPPKTLEYFKSFGFKTFGDFWDESYDQETDHGIRMKKILEVIKYIDSFSNKELKNLYLTMQKILNYNYLLMFEKSKRKVNYLK